MNGAPSGDNGDRPFARFIGVPRRAARAALARWARRIATTPLLRRAVLASLDRVPALRDRLRLALMRERAAQAESDVESRRRFALPVERDRLDDWRLSLGVAPQGGDAP